MFLHYYLGLVCLLFVPSFGNSNATEQPVTDEDVFFPYDNQRYDTFDWQLLKAFESPELGNVIVSPLSIKLLLAILYEGAGGTTAYELASVLELPVTRELVREKYTKILAGLKTSTGVYDFTLGTKLYLDSKYRAKAIFINRTKQFYQADVQNIDFSQNEASAEKINKWVGDITKGKITDLVSADDLSDDAAMLMVNAMFFKGQWRNQFPRNQTTTGGFYVSTTQSVTVQYMRTSGRYYYSESKDLDAKILRMPYRGSRMSMYIVLPNSKTGVAELIRNLSPRILKHHLWLIDELNVDVTIPKFKFEFTSKMGRTLQKMGLRQIFQNTAYFPGLLRKGNGTQRLAISNIIQKAGLEVNEEGSTAYAATEIVLGNKFGAPDNIFYASHPFIFFIEDESTGTLLFLGKVENPLNTLAKPFPIELGAPSRFSASYVPETTSNPMTSDLENISEDDSETETETQTMKTSEKPATVVSPGKVPKKMML